MSKQMKTFLTIAGCLAAGHILAEVLDVEAKLDELVRGPLDFLPASTVDHTDTIVAAVVGAAAVAVGTAYFLKGK